MVNSISFNQSAGLEKVGNNKLTTYPELTSPSLEFGETLDSDLFVHTTPVEEISETDDCEKAEKTEQTETQEISKQNGSFYTVQNIGYTEWGQRNDDGSYTLYGQSSTYGAEPEVIETITADEAAERGYISEQNASFHSVQNMGYTEWGQINNDGSYTLYGQSSTYGAVPEVKETITADEAAERGYIS